MFQSLDAMNSGLIDEVILVDVNPDRTIPYLSKFHSRTPIHHFELDGIYHRHGHALGLHHAIDSAKNKYLLLSDPDVIFLMPAFDRFYLETYQKHDLHLLGMEHHTSARQAFLRFPTVVNMFVDRERLPTKEFMAVEVCTDPVRDIFSEESRPDKFPSDKSLLMNGKYLLCNNTAQHKEKFPNPTGVYDVGCNLFLWMQKTGGRWLSFLHTKGTDAKLYPRAYTTKNVNNFGLEDDFGAASLLFHHRRGSTQYGTAKRILQEVWERQQAKMSH